MYFLFMATYSFNYNYSPFFQNFNDINNFFDHQMKFRRGNDPYSGELSYISFSLGAAVGT